MLEGAEQATNAQARTFVTLDGLRGIAAIFVIFWHVQGIGRDIVSSGYLAVDLFFILSGFVLAYRYEGKLRSDFSAWQFIKMRAIRLYPLYVLGTLIGAAIGLARLLQGGPGVFDFFRYGFKVVLGVLMLPNVVGSGGNVFPFNAPAWSLFYEMAINIVFAFILRYLGMRWLVAIVAVAAVVLCAEALHFGHLRLTVTMPLFLYASVRVVFGFFMGVLIYRLHASGRLPAWHVHPIIPCILLVLTMFGPLGAPYGGWAAIVIVLFAYPFITALSLHTEPTGALARMMSWLGILSFPLYAIHSPLLILARQVALKLHVPPTIGQVAAIPVIIALAWLAQQYFDKPVRHRLTQWARRHEKRPPSTGPDGDGSNRLAGGIS